MRTDEWKKKQIDLFYRYLRPSATSLLVYNQINKSYSSEIISFVSNKEDFINKTIENNKKGDCFACRNRFHTSRRTENITFLKSWVIDIDDDIENTKSIAFEDVCEKYNVYIEAKAKSRVKGGWHYYIPYKPTDITNNNREFMINIGKSFKDWLVSEHNLDIDTKVFDLPRLIRIWGTYNHRRESYCELIKCQTATPQQIEHNTRFINSLLKEKKESEQPLHLVTSCDLVEYVRNHELLKTGTSKNDKLLKNISIFLFTTLGNDGLKIAEEICRKQNHNIGEVHGWWEKAKSGKIKQFSCGELNLWIKKYYPELMKVTCAVCKLHNKNKVEYLNGNETFYNLKKMTREKKKLFINKELFLQGIISPSLTNYKQEVIIFRIFQKESDDILPDERIVFFDEKKPASKKWHEVRSFGVDFYIYEFIHEGVKCTLFSEKKLDFGEYFIEGNTTKIFDQLLVGNYTKISSKKKIILVNSAKSVIQKIMNHQHLFSLTDNFKRIDYLDFIFSHYNEIEKKTYIYRQPKNINDLILGFLFSSKFEYPLHLCLYGNPDSGKSTILSAIFSKFNESYQIVDGSISSIKGLIPSFSKRIPELGVVLESKRICAIDEFFRLIKNKNEDEDKISMLNNLLLHTKYGHRTGKGNIDGVMKSKMFIVTNPIYGSDFRDTIENLPPSTLDRILIWQQYREHYNWVRNGDYKVVGTPLIDKYLFLGIYDYLNSFQSNFDKNKLKEIIKEIRAKCPDFMLNLYDARYSHHHSLCLLDGLIKVRCLLEKDKSFIAVEKDYKTFFNVWENLVVSWREGNISDFIITEEQRELLSIVKKYPDIWDYQLQELCSKKNIEYKHNYKRLLHLKMIKVEKRKINIIKEKEITLNDIDI